MKIFGFLIWGLAAVTAGYSLFYVSYKVEAMEQELAKLNREILKEQETVHVLEAEWSYLTRPDRLQKLTNELLPDLAPMTAQQFTSFDELPLKPQTGDLPTTESGRPKAPTATMDQKSRPVSYNGGE